MTDLLAPVRRRVAARRLVVAAWLLLSASPATAQPPANPRDANPERPTVATHAYAVAPGIVEMEAGVQWQVASGLPILADVAVESLLKPNCSATPARAGRPARSRSSRS